MRATSRPQQPQSFTESFNRGISKTDCSGDGEQDETYADRTIGGCRPSSARLHRHGRFEIVTAAIQEEYRVKSTRLERRALVYKFALVVALTVMLVDDWALNFR